MKQRDTLVKKYLVTSYEVDPEGVARLTSIANYLQETAYHHASQLNLGYHQLAAKNLAWILSRMRIKVHKHPSWEEEVTVETWPRGIEQLFALRDFRLTDSGGRLLAEASTCWLMLDTKTHRPVRIPEDLFRIKTRTDSVFEESPGKINLPEKLELVKYRKVTYSDLDVVGHVNNVKYIEWCTDIIEPELLIANHITDFTINFIGEAVAGQEVEIRATHENKKTGHIQGINRSTGKECFRTRLII